MSAESRANAMNRKRNKDFIALVLHLNGSKACTADLQDRPKNRLFWAYAGPLWGDLGEVIRIYRPTDI